MDAQGIEKRAHKINKIIIINGAGNSVGTIQVSSGSAAFCKGEAAPGLQASPRHPREGTGAAEAGDVKSGAGAHGPLLVPEKGVTTWVGFQALP